MGSGRAYLFLVFVYLLQLNQTGKCKRSTVFSPNWPIGYQIYAFPSLNKLYQFPYFQYYETLSLSKDKNFRNSVNDKPKGRNGIIISLPYDADSKIIIKSPGNTAQLAVITESRHLSKNDTKTQKMGQVRDQIELNSESKNKTTNDPINSEDINDKTSQLSKHGNDQRNEKENGNQKLNDNKNKDFSEEEQSTQSKDHSHNDQSTPKNASSQNNTRLTNSEIINPELNDKKLQPTNNSANATISKIEDNQNVSNSDNPNQNCSDSVQQSPEDLNEDGTSQKDNKTTSDTSPDKNDSSKEPANTSNSNNSSNGEKDLKQSSDNNNGNSDKQVDVDSSDTKQETGN